MILPHECCYSSPKDNFPSILLLNARSIFNKLDELSSLVFSMRPHIIAISESWLTSAISSDLLHLNGYVFYRMDRVGRTGGGVCLWVSICFRSIIVSTYTAPTSTEILCAKIPSLKTFVGVVYIPPNLPSNEKSSISAFFENVFDEELAICPDLKFIVCGDFNDFNSSIFRHYFGLKNCVETPTRGESVLDQIWMSSTMVEHYVTCAEVGPPLGTSDHRTVFLPTRDYSVSARKRIVKLKDYRMSNLAHFGRALSSSDFSPLEREESLDNKCSLF